MEWRYISDKIHDALQYFDEAETYGCTEEQNCQGIIMNLNLALNIVQDYYKTIQQKYLVSIISRF